jgi:hypothetical protein
MTMKLFETLDVIRHKGYRGFFSSVFNTEGGQAYISDERMPYCDQCYLEFSQSIDCQNCGRSSNNFIKFGSGEGDGIYAILELCIPGGELLGGLIIFDSDLVMNMVDLVNNGSSRVFDLDFSEVLENSEGICIGNITLNGNSEDDQIYCLYVGDSGADGADSSGSYALSHFVANPGDYSVFLFEKRIAALILPSKKLKALGINDVNVWSQDKIRDFAMGLRNETVRSHVKPAGTEAVLINVLLSSQSYQNGIDIDVIPNQDAEFPTWLVQLNDLAPDSVPEQFRDNLNESLEYLESQETINEVRSLRGYAKTEEKLINEKKLAKSLLEGNLAVVKELEDSGLEIEGELLEAITSPSLPFIVMQKISESSWWGLPVALLGNPNLPKDILKNMLHKPNSDIYHYQVQQAFLQSETVHNDLYEDVLNGKTSGIWSHLNSSEKQRRKEILISLNNENLSDRNISSSLGLLFEEVGELDKAHQIWENAYGSAPQESQNELLDIEGLDYFQLRDLAMHPLTNKKTLFNLSFSNDDEIESLVASNPSTPPCLIAYYAESLWANGEPSSLALENPKIPSFVWPWIERELAEVSLSWEPHQLAISAAAMNHGLPLNLMEIFAKSDNFTIRYNLSVNPCVPQHIKETILLEGFLGDE